MGRATLARPTTDESLTRADDCLLGNRPYAIFGDSGGKVGYARWVANLLCFQLNFSFTLTVARFSRWLSTTVRSVGFRLIRGRLFPSRSFMCHMGCAEP